MKERPPVLVCSRVLDGQPHVASSTAKCQACGALVWVSPASRRHAETVGARPICVPCVAALGEPIQPVAPSSEVLAEIRGVDPDAAKIVERMFDLEKRN